MAKLFPPIARAHGVTVERALQSITERPVAFDFAVMFSFALLYTLAAAVAARWLSRKFVDGRADPDGIVMTLYVSPVISLARVLIGEAWALTADGLRLRTGHLSGEHRLSSLPGRTLPQRKGKFFVYSGRNCDARCSSSFSNEQL